MEGQRRVGSLVWPLVLIGLGVVLLLNNLGMLDWSVWEMILRLWPVLLIGLGLELLIGRRSVWGSLLAALMVLAVLAGAVFLFRSPGRTAGTTETVSQALGGAERGEVTIDFGVGRLTVDAGAAGDMLVEGRVTLAAGQRLISEGRVAGGVAYYRIGSEDSGAAWLGGAAGERREWALHLNPTVPLALTLRSGVGETRLDLSGLQVTDLEIHSGVGQVVVLLPGQGRVRVSVDAGVGELVLRVPRSMAVRMEVDGGLGQVSVPTDFEREDEMYLSPGFDTSQDRADIQVDGGVGRIVVEWQP